MVSEANVLARVLKMLPLGELDAGGDGSGKEFIAGDNGADLSDWKDCDLPPIGIVRFFNAD